MYLCLSTFLEQQHLNIREAFSFTSVWLQRLQYHRCAARNTLVEF